MRQAAAAQRLGARHGELLAQARDAKGASKTRALSEAEGVRQAAIDLFGTSAKSLRDFEAASKFVTGDTAEPEAPAKAAAKSRTVSEADEPTCEFLTARPGRDGMAKRCSKQALPGGKACEFHVDASYPVHMDDDFVIVETKRGLRVRPVSEADENAETLRYVAPEPKAPKAEAKAETKSPGKAAAKDTSPKVTCKGQAANGPCGQTVLKPNGFCRLHQSQASSEAAKPAKTRAASSRKARTAKVEKPVSPLAAKAARRRALRR